MSKNNNNNIWYISKYASPIKYFFGTRHFYLAEEFIKKGYPTTVITSNSNHLTDKLPQFEGNYMNEDINGVDTVWVKTPQYKDSASIRRILSWLVFELRVLQVASKIENKPSVIIVSSLSLLTIISGYILKRKYSAKLVFEVRDIWPLTILCTTKTSRYHPFVLFLSFLEKFAYKSSDLIVGTMPNLQSHVEKIIDRKANVICIPQGLSLDIYENQQEIEQDFIETYLPKDKFIVAYAGTLGRINAIEQFILAAKAIEVIDNNIFFLIIGDGGLKHKLIEKAKNIKNIAFVPKVHKTKVQSILRRVNVLYFGTLNLKLYEYGISFNKMIDYLYSEKPILASISGFEDTINTAQCGIIVPAEDVDAIINGIIQLKKMPPKDLNEMGLRGKKFLLENRTFEKLAEKYLHHIEMIKKVNNTESI